MKSGHKGCGRRRLEAIAAGGGSWVFPSVHAIPPSRGMGFLQYQGAPDPLQTASPKGDSEGGALRRVAGCLDGLRDVA